jgi:type IV pilus assembly protein PilE
MRYKPCRTAYAGKQRSAGFTLIELLVVVAILMVLTAISYPAYTRYVIKVRRAEAQATLLELMQKQERYFTQHNTYLVFSSQSSDPDAKHFRWWSGARPASSGYELHGEACADEPIERCIVLKAVPGTDRVDKSFRDPDCGVLALHSIGRRESEGLERICWP